MASTNIVIILQNFIGGGDGDESSLLKRAYQFLEDRDWFSAYIYCDRVLDINPENAAAYVGKLMADLQVRKPEYLEYQEEPFDRNRNYLKALRYGDDALKATLTGYTDSIKRGKELDRLDNWYRRGRERLADAEKNNTASAYSDAAGYFEWAQNYKDAADLAKKCRSKGEVLKKDETLSEAKEKMKGDSVSDFEEALKLLESISKWKDAGAKASECRKKIKQLKSKEEAERWEAERQAELARLEAERKALLKKKRLKIAAVCACAALVLVILLNTVILPAVRYSNAMSLLEAGQADEAYEIFRKLGDYKDAEEQSGAIRISRIPKSIQPGMTVKFGSYEQDNRKSNGKEDIEWKVLDVQNGWAFVISEQILDYQPYHKTNTNVTWETCSLRKWLNGKFLEEAFSDVEKAVIPTVIVKAHANPRYDTDPGNSTEDKIYLLSIPEAEYYFRNTAANCQATAYALDRGVYANLMSGDCWWWMRSPGNRQNYAAGYHGGRDAITYGSEVNSTISSFRPVLWIDLT